MSKRAEESAMKAYPVHNVGDPTLPYGEWDLNGVSRRSFQEGYEQAEKDIIALIQSRLSEIIGDAQPKPALRAELRELIEKIKEDEE